MLKLTFFIPVPSTGQLADRGDPRAEAVEIDRRVLEAALVRLRQAVEFAGGEEHPAQRSQVKASAPPAILESSCDGSRGQCMTVTSWDP